MGRLAVKKYLWLFVVLSLLGACSTGYCRRAKDQTGTPVGPEEAIDQKANADANKRRIFVYKYDGSMQCGMGRTIGLEDMAKELAGIKIYSQKKKADGLMHIQVCGSPTGQANVYEIAEDDLAKAESLSFKKWSFE